MSLFDKYGGEKYWGPVFISFLDTVRQDEQLGRFFTGADLVSVGRSMLTLFQQALGFEAGHFPTSIRRTHAHLNILQSDYAQFIRLFDAIIKRNGVADADASEITEVLLAFQRDIVKKER